ncbi:hypothetical protein D3C71_1547790 [compost metagenome]
MRPQLAARQPQLRAPAVGQGCDLAHRGDAGRVAAVVAVDGLVPAQAVFLVRVQLQGAPQCFQRQGFVVAFRVDLGQIGQHHARLAVPRAKVQQRLLAVVQASGFHVHDGLQDDGALAVVVQLDQAFGGAQHLVEESVVERLDDKAGKLVGVVPVLLDGARQDVVAPLIARDMDLAALGIVGPDQVGIAGGVGVVAGGLPGGKFLLEAHAWDR